MGKPAFDPSQPYQVVGGNSKPAFDPSKPYSVAGAQQPQDQPSTLDNIASAINSGVNGAAKWATGGYTPQIDGALHAAGVAAKDFATSGDGTVDYDNVLNEYKKARDATIDLENRSYEKHPIAYGAGAVTGGLISPLNKLAAPFEAAEGAGIAAKAVTAAKNGALLGAVTNPGDTKGVVDPLQVAPRLLNTGAGAVTGGLVDTGLNAAPVVAKKTISTLFGPSEDAIDKYLANRERISTAPNVATMKDMIDQQVKTLQDAVDKGQISVDEAKGHLSDLNDQLSQVTRDSGKEFSQSLPQLRESVDNAYNELGVQKQGVQNTLQAVPHPREMADDVHQAVADLKDQVVNESAKARNILAQSGDTIATKPLRDQLQQAKEAFYVDGAPPVTPQAQAAVQRIEQLAQDMSKLPSNLKGDAAKKLVQQLDEEVEYSREAGGFGSGYDKVIKGLRQNIDAQLKQNPDYAQQMSKVAEKTRLLDQANQLFGTREKAYSAMGNIASDSRIPQQDILQQLGEHTGNDFVSPLRNYQAAQSTLKNGMPSIVENLPAQEKVKAAETINDMAPHLKDAYVQTMQNESGLPDKISAQEAELERLKGVLSGAQANADQVSGWTPASTQNKIQGIISRSPDRASIEANRQLEQLEALRGQHEGPTYQQSIDDNRVLNQFNRDNTRGSRNAVIWKALGGAAGAGVGAVVPGSHVVTVPGLAAAGAAFGGYVDKKGGQLARGALDHYLNNKDIYDAIQGMNANRIVSPYLMMRQKGSQ